MKYVFNFLKGLVFIIAIIGLTRLYYKQGLKDFLREREHFFVPYSFIQKPPQVRFNCHQFCGEVTYMTWNDYVKTYKRFMKEQEEK